MSYSVPAASVPEGSVTGVEEYAVGNNGNYFAVGRKCSRAVSGASSSPNVWLRLLDGCGGCRAHDP